MKRRFPGRRRPSAAMAVAVLALFAALGGVGWAATALPAGSVGTRQLRPGAVTYPKIARHTIGAQRINQNQVQTRVGGTCPAGRAISAVGRTGGVLCTPTSPSEFGASSAATPLGSTSAAILTKTLPAGSSYLVLANPSALITSAGNTRVTVTCTLAVGSATQTRNLMVATGTAGSQQEEALPLQLPAGSGTATLSCRRTAAGAAPAVVVTAALDAIGTAANG
jgi:hypothetical protein